MSGREPPASKQNRPLLFALAGFVFGLAAGVLLAAVLVTALYKPAN
jgi:hypothetical protein